MSWFAVGGAAVSVIGGVISDKKESKQRKEDKAFSKEQMSLENQYTKEQMKYGKELDYEYEQKRKADRQRGLDQFRKFSTVKDFAPTYVDTAARVQPPVAGTTPAPIIPKVVE